MEDIKCPCCNSENIRQDYDFENMLCCEGCGADFIKDGELTFNPKTDV